MRLTAFTVTFCTCDRRHSPLVVQSGKIMGRKLNFLTNLGLRLPNTVLMTKQPHGIGGTEDREKATDELD